MRRATFAVAHFPRIPVFDPLIDFPKGGVGIWPPLFDVALALPARMLYGAAASRDAIATEAAAGLALGLAALTWQGAICWGALYGLVLAIDALRRPSAEIFRATAIVFGAAALVDAAGVAYWVRGESVPFTFISFGAFQPAFLGSMAAGTIAVAAAIGLLRRERPSAFLPHLASLALLAAILRRRIPDIARNLAGGIGYVTKTSHGAAVPGGLTSFPREMLRQIYEVRPLFGDGFHLAFDTLSAAFFLVPIAVAIWIARAIRGPRRSAHLALSGWALLTLWLALSQRLNIYYAAPLAALAGWEISRQAGTRAARAWARLPGNRASARIRIAVAVGLLITAIPGLRRQLATRYAPGDDLIATMEWVRTRLPHAVSAYDARFLPPVSAVPELDRAESMLSPWALGHFVTFYGELPAPADAFGYGFDDSVRFFLAPTEEEALAITRRRRTRWIAATDLSPKMNDYAKILGLPPPIVVRDGRPEATPAYFRTMQSRLYDFDGAGAEPLAHFRLIHASRTGTMRGSLFIARWKIFEVVDRGARAEVPP